MFFYRRVQETGRIENVVYTCYMSPQYDLCIIGGAGHVGLPLGVAFANRGVGTVLFDTNISALQKIQSGLFPFLERNGNRELSRALKTGRLSTAHAPDVIARSRFVLLVVGTPIDEYLNPDIHGISSTLEEYFPYFRDGQILVLRSTVYPGTSGRIQKYLRDKGKRVGVAFCPERIAQGRALEEISKLPQIVAAFDPRTSVRVISLFKKVTSGKIITAQPIEAELAKLFSNAWRYIKFAVANQFFMIASDHNLDYHKIHQAMCEGYPRNRDLPPPGFAAGPCLLKDTMQLAAFHSNNFFLGHSAMLVNEGLPNFLIKKLKHAPVSAQRESLRPVARTASTDYAETLFHGSLGGRNLRDKTIGILGMTFKADSDDPRDSLSYKLKKIAESEAKRVLCHDVYIKDPSFHPLPDLLKESDVVILAAPHKEYRSIDPRKFPGKHFVDIWNFWRGARHRQ